MVDTNTLFQLLADDTRRRILYALCDNESITIPEDILARDQALPQETRSRRSTPRQANEWESQLETELHHVHLPKLADDRVIEWRPEADTVSRGPQFEDLEPILRLFGANQTRFPDDFL